MVEVNRWRNAMGTSDSNTSSGSIDGNSSAMVHFCNFNSPLFGRFQASTRTIMIIAVDILSLVHPFKPFSYWSKQFIEVTKSVYQGDHRNRVQSHVEYAFLVGGIIQFISLTLWPPTGQLEQAYRMDIIAMNGQGPLAKLELALCIASVVYFYYVHYNKYCLIPNVHKTARALTGQRWEQAAILFTNRDLIERTRRSMLFVWRLFGMFIMITGKHLARCNRAFLVNAPYPQI